MSIQSPLTLAIFLSILSHFSYLPSASACKCAPRAVAEELADASAVFEGRVTQIQDLSEGDAPQARQLRVTLALVRVWKSLESVETVEVTTNIDSAACGFYFEQGRSYLVYARADAGEPLRVTSCSRTRPMQDAAEDLAALGGGVTPVKVTSAPTPPEGAKANLPLAAPAEEDSTAPEKKARGGCSVHVAGEHTQDANSRTSLAGTGAFALLAFVSLVRRRRQG